MEKVKKFGSALAIVIVVVVLAVLFWAFCITTVPTGYTGVGTRFGKITGVTYEAGLHITSPFVKIVKMDNRIQKESVQLSSFSSDIQEVEILYTVNFQIDKTTAPVIYETIGVDYYTKVISPSITESVKTISAQYTAEQLVSNRAVLAQGIEDDLKDRLKQYNVMLVSSSIENIDFTDAFTDAVEAKQVAQQNKLRAETEAEQKRIEAQADADVQLIKAKAEAEANDTISKSLTEMILRKEYLDKWDGILPTTMLGSDAQTFFSVSVDPAESSDQQ